MHDFNDGKPRHKDEPLIDSFNQFVKGFALKAGAPVREKHKIGEIDFAKVKDDPLLKNVYDSVLKRMPK